MPNRTCSTATATVRNAAVHAKAQVARPKVRARASGTRHDW
ncbi:MAG: hypothetical protein JWO36_3945, partial [Myxococcales bacterium]|nr:hypothetical protein [Myxococcales bacterium]